MRALSDKWNPRLWLRDWLIRPSNREALIAARTNAGIRAAIKAWHSEQSEKKQSPEAMSRVVGSAVGDCVKSALETGNPSDRRSLAPHFPSARGLEGVGPGSPL